MDDIAFRRAEGADAPFIAELFCTGFSPAVAELLIYGCSGAANYIRMQIASHALHSASAYFVAHTSDHVLAAVELRLAPDRLFLNYIGVHREYQGRRMGTNLLAAALRMSDVGVGQISLDVFDDNAQALKWYGRLGFQIRQTSELIEIMPPMTPSEWRAYLSDLPQADLCQERFGFSRFNLVTVQRTWSIGRIGDGWFRLDDAAALGDASVFAALRALDPRRRIFAAVPQFSVAPTIEARLLATTHRMEAEISQVLHTIDLAQ